MSQDSDQKDNQPPYMMFGIQAQAKLIEGAKLMYNAVCTTLSPKGRNVAIQRQWGAPIVIHDGVTVAREVKSKDRFVQIGINMMKEAAQRTNDEAGDGTTTSTLLAYELIERGVRLKAMGVNPMILRSELQDAAAQAIAELAKIKKPVKGKADLMKVAAVSSASKEIGDMVGAAVHEMGGDGLVTVEESGTYDTWVEKTKGMSLSKGYASPYFVTDPFRMEAVLNKPTIIVTDKTITTNREIVPIIETIIKAGSKSIVIVGEVNGQALQTLVANKMNGTINCVVVRPPGYGDNRAGFLEDVAVMSGGQLISKELGLDMEEFMATFDTKVLGKCDKVVVNAKASLFVNGRGTKKQMQEQLALVRRQAQDAGNPAMKEIFDERIAKLTTGVAVIRVGAKTEIEAREKVERVKDAVGAAQAALQEGFVAGSGVTFLRLAKAITGMTEGAKLLREVLDQPLRKLLDNCGEPHKRITDLVETLRADKSKDTGYDAMKGELTNVVKAGIIDPAKVIRLCVENAIGVATSVLTTEVLIDYEVFEKPD